MPKLSSEKGKDLTWVSEILSLQKYNYYERYDTLSEM